MSSFSVSGNLVDVHQEKIYPATITVENGIIVSIVSDMDGDSGPDKTLNYILPGFIDSHVHIESSMLVPSEFAKLAVVHGTVATISDPHEIANVCGIAGVEFMIENGKTVPFKFNFGAPSCVPATIFETAGAALDAIAVEKLLVRDEIKYLSEMMNFPGVLSGDEEVMKKISAAHRRGKPVDGHAPGLRGDDARRYIQAPLNPSQEGIVNSGNLAIHYSHQTATPINTTSQIKASKNPLEGREAIITTDHECFTAEEALDKLQYGMKIIVREGSAAKNFDALIGLLNDHSDRMMFCSDDKHPDSLVLGHINQLCARAVAKGIDLFKVLKAACLNPVYHYKLEVGLLKTGNAADFIVVKDLEHFAVLKTFIDGQLVAENGKSNIVTMPSAVINNFSCTKKEPDDFAISATDTTPPVTTHHSPLVIPVIEALEGQLITNKLEEKGKIESGRWVSDTERDILKIVVVNRYKDEPVAKSFIKNFGLKQGALASSVAHDSHNIVAVGVDDESICKAVNMIIEHRGGISCVKDNLELIVPLPVAGLMSNEDGYHVSQQYSLIDQAAKEAGSSLASPFMTLSFMALLVIPHLKLSDKGLFDGDEFDFVNKL